MRARDALNGLLASVRRPAFVAAIALAASVAVAATARATPLPPAGAGQETATPVTPPAPFIPYASRLSLSPDDAAPGATMDPSRTTLAPPPAEIGGVDDVDIAPRRTVVLSSQSTWEKGFDALAATFRALDEIVMAAGFDVRGRPLAVFTQTEDTGFKFDAMLPVAVDGAEGEAQEALRQAVVEHAAAKADREKADKTDMSAGPAPDVRLGVSPSGKAFRFIHASAYDDIDAAYEAITTYLDSKNIIVRDAFIEEYVTDLTVPTDESLEVYIYVQPVEPGGGPSQPKNGAGPATLPPAADADAPPAGKDVPE
ncbi:hypothetical protein ACUSIJ_01690 [Pseudochelatococcus sp. B33]